MDATPYRTSSLNGSEPAADLPLRSYYAVDTTAKPDEPFNLCFRRVCLAIARRDAEQSLSAASSGAEGGRGASRVIA